MESLLILIGIFVLDAIVKHVSNKRKQQTLPKPENPDFDEEEQVEEDTSENQTGRPPRNLEELIRQFDKAQRDASGGTFVPPVPPVDDADDNDESLDDTNDEDSDSGFNPDDFPVVKPAHAGHYSFNEIAESVVQWEYVSTELLEQAFGFSENTSRQVLADLQAHRIVSRDMGDGYCDILIHNSTELANLFKKERQEAERRKSAEAESAAQNKLREAEMTRQRA